MLITEENPDGSGLIPVRFLLVILLVLHVSKVTWTLVWTQHFLQKGLNTSNSCRSFWRFLSNKVRKSSQRDKINNNLKTCQIYLMSIIKCKKTSLRFFSFFIIIYLYSTKRQTLNNRLFLWPLYFITKIGETVF